MKKIKKIFNSAVLFIKKNFFLRKEEIKEEKIGNFDWFLNNIFFEKTSLKKEDRGYKLTSEQKIILTGLFNNQHNLIYEKDFVDVNSSLHIYILYLLVFKKNIKILYCCNGYDKTQMENLIFCNKHFFKKSNDLSIKINREFSVSKTLLNSKYNNISNILEISCSHFLINPRTPLCFNRIIINRIDDLKNINYELFYNSPKLTFRYM